MAGLTAAKVLAEHFEQVTVLERDELPDDASARAGIPQGRHVHVLLAGGQRTLADLFPGFEEDLARGGAVRLQVDLDIKREIAGHDDLPRRDLGFHCYAQSRPRLEATVRERIRTRNNVALEPRCRVQTLTSNDGGRTVSGLTYLDPDGRGRVLEADLVVDASGRGALTTAFLEETGHPLPEATTIGVDMCYSTAVFEASDDAQRDWKGVFIYPRPPETSRGGLLMPLEGGRWIVSLGGRLGEDPPGDADGFFAYTKSLHSPTIYNAVSAAPRVGQIARFRFPESIRRHYERLTSFPRGLLPIGDSLCRFNPIYGQGMTVAAQEARALGQLLSARTAESEPLDGLALDFFSQAQRITETPWATAALPDLVYPGTRGERPTDFEQQIRKSAALSALMASDPDVHKLVTEVRQLLKPNSAFDDEWVTERLADTAA